MSLSFIHFEWVFEQRQSKTKSIFKIYSQLIFYSAQTTHTVAQKVIKQLSQLFSLEWEIKRAGT